MDKFIVTEDKALAEKLTQSGMVCLGENNGMFTFLNDGNLPMKFSDNTKIIFTNKLCI